MLVCILAVLLRRSAGLLLREAPLAVTDTAGRACTQLAFRPVPVPPIFKGLRAGVPNAYTVTSGFSTAAAGQPQLPGVCEVVGRPAAAPHLLLPGLLLQLGGAHLRQVPYLPLSLAAFLQLHQLLQLLPSPPAAGGDVQGGH